MEIKRCYDTIVGASVGENQLVDFYDTTRTASGITIVRENGVEFRYSGTSTASSYVDAGAFTGDDDFLKRFVVGHRYILYSVSTDNKLYCVINNPYTDLSASQFGGRKIIIYTPTALPTYLYVRIACSNGEAVSGRGAVNVIDLTAELGSSITDYIYSLESATAGAGIAKLREWGFLKGYQAFNAGSIESVEVTGKKVVGFNAWDEEWEVGAYNTSSGQKQSTSAGRIRSKNFISALPNTAYFAQGLVDGVLFYDSEQTYISYTTSLSAPFTTPANCAYLTFYSKTNYGATYNNDICINLSNPDRNGEYEAYTEQEYDYGDDTLRGIFKLDASNNIYADGDRKEADGTITRKYGVVDFGTLTWSTGTDSSGQYFKAILSPVAKSKTGADFGNNICSKYPMTSSTNVYDKSIAINNAGNTIYVRDTSYSTASDFQTAMNGVYLVYELATPTTETSTPFTSPQIVYPDGTEEFVTENNVPVGHESKYQL